MRAAPSPIVAGLLLTVALRAGAQASGEDAQEAPPATSAVASEVSMDGADLVGSPDTGSDTLLFTPEPRVLTLHEALDLAAAQARSVLAAGERLAIARSEAREASLAWLPALGASIGQSKTEGQAQGSFGDFRDVDYRSAAPWFRVTWGLNPGEVAFGSRAARTRAMGAEALEGVARRDALLLVADLYFDLAQAQARRRVADRAVADTSDLARISAALVKTGLGRGDELQRATAARADAERRLVDAQRQAWRASIRLSTALDLAPTVRLVADERYPPIAMTPLMESEFATILADALATRPEIRAAQQEADARRADVQRAISAVAVPTLAVFHEEGWTGETLGDLDGLDRTGIQATWGISAAGLQRVKTARLRAANADLLVRDAEARVRAEVAAAGVDVVLASSALQAARAARSASDEVLRLSRVRFRNGIGPALETLLAQQAREQAELAEASALIDASRAQLHLRAQGSDVSAANMVRE